MDDGEVLGWLSKQVAGGSLVFSVCTGALLLGAAGLLKGRRATTHWASLDLLPYYGASPVDERVVADGNMIFAAGVTAGIDGALRLAAELRGEAAAEAIQLASPTHPNRPSTAGGQRRPRLLSWWPPSGPWQPSALAGRTPPGGSLSASASASETTRKDGASERASRLFPVGTAVVRNKSF